VSSFVTQEMVNAFLEAAQPKWRESLSWFRHEKRVVAGLSALSAMPPASRLALARALVPGWAVVPREATVAMLNACKGAVRSHNQSLRKAGILEKGEFISHESSPAILYRAMLTAAEEPPHGP